MHLPSKTRWILVAGLGAAVAFASLGAFGWPAGRTPDGLPLELRRERHSRANWSTGGRTEYWTYAARWRGRALRFSAPEHRYRGDPGATEAFEHVNEGYALGRTAVTGDDVEGRAAAEALLLNMGPDPSNAPRWFLVQERAGALEVTWLASTSSDEPPVWQVWDHGQARRPPPGDEEIHGQAGELGLVPLRRWVAGLTLTGDGPPRYLLVGRTALVELATRRVIPLPEGDAASVRTQPLGLSPDGRSFLFQAVRGEEASGLEAVALETGEVRWLPIDWQARHLRHGLDLTRAWVEAALEWREEAPGRPAWMRWKEGARYPIWTGRLRAPSPTAGYDLEGYQPALLPEVLALLRRELDATVHPYDGAGLEPGEAAHRVVVEGASLYVGLQPRSGLHVFVLDAPGGPALDQANAAVARVAAAIDGALRAGRWQALEAPRAR